MTEKRNILCKIFGHKKEIICDKQTNSPIVYCKRCGYTERLMDYTKRKVKYLIICGSSFSGKTTLLNRLDLLNDKENPYLKHLTQLTTRPLRYDEGERQGDPYVFVTERMYEKFDKDKLLIGRIKSKNHNEITKGYNYGTLNDYNDNLINACILNKEGLKDFIENYYDPEIHDLKVLMIKPSLETLLKRQEDLKKSNLLSDRLNRNLEQEYTELDDIISMFVNPTFLNPDEKEYNGLYILDLKDEPTIFPDPAKIYLLIKKLFHI